MSDYKDEEVQKLQQDMNNLSSIMKGVKREVEQQRIQARQLNRSEGLLSKLKKTFVLSKIMIFLNDTDILNLALTNKSFNKLIYSPIGYKILFFSRSQYAQKKLINVLQQDEQEKIKKQQSQQSGLDASSVTALMERFNSAKYESGEDFEAQLMTFKHTMSILADELHKKLEQNAYFDELFQEKSNHDKYVTKIKILNTKLLQLENEVEESKTEQLKQQEQQMQELLQLQGQKKKFIEENELLTNQKNELELKYEETKTQLEQVSKAKELYLESLKKFRNLIVDVNY